MSAAEVDSVRHHMRQFGFVPKCYADAGEGDTWLMVYENPMAPMSKRFFVGVYLGTTELLRHIYHSDTAARIDFERRVEAGA